MSEFISLNEARTMIDRYAEQKPLILREGQPAGLLPVCETFSGEHVKTLLSHTDCQDLRAYFAMDDKNEIKLVLVGVNSEDTDICDGSNTLLDKGNRCPSNCPPDSPLNS